MSGDIRWEDHLTASLERIFAKSHELDADMADGATVVLDESQVLVPKRTGDLAATGSIKEDRGGTNTVAIVYSSVYSRYVHEHIGFRHPFGGTSKFLETAMLTKGEEAINKAGKHFWGRIT